MSRRRESITDWAMTGLVAAILVSTAAYVFGEGRWYDEQFGALVIVLTLVLMFLGAVFGYVIGGDD